MESKLSWISEQTVFDIELFAEKFDYEAQESIDQKKLVVAKKALSDAQTAIIGKASDLVPGTLDQVGKPKQKKNTGKSLLSTPSTAAAASSAAVPLAISTLDGDDVTTVDIDNKDGSEKAQGCTDEAPQVPTDIPSTNLKRLVAYAHRVLTANDTQLHDLKDVYVALSCIVSTTVKNASNIFGSSLITRIANQVTLKEVALPILAKVLLPLQESFARNDYDLNFLQQEVELRLAELVLCERDGSWVTKEEKVDLAVSRQLRGDLFWPV
ncbi:hypothetical protein EC991_009583 [Linnemannia zychae]|nr:hypothetical protein EC991_009583 [Linnemannia zychae]